MPRPRGGSPILLFTQGTMCVYCDAEKAHFARPNVTHLLGPTCRTCKDDALLHPESAVHRLDQKRVQRFLGAMRCLGRMGRIGKFAELFLTEGGAQLGTHLAPFMINLTVSVSAADLLTADDDVDEWLASAEAGWQPSLPGRTGALARDALISFHSEARTVQEMFANERWNRLLDHTLFDVRGEALLERGGRPYWSL